MDQENAFKFTGQVIEEPNALYPNDDKNKPINGHTVLLAQMGMTLPFYCKASDIPAPKVGDMITVVGRLEPNPKANGWPKCKAQKSRVVKSAPVADKQPA